MPQTPPSLQPTCDVPEAAKLRGLRWLVTQNALNATFAYLTVFGSVFLLFLNELGLPKAQIGLMLSLLPFSGLLALGTSPITTRLGRKRVFIACWTARKFAVAGLLLLPWVLARYGHAGGLVYLLVCVGLFAMLRAIAEAAWFPWLQEVVPDRLRGRFGGMSSVLTTVGACVALGVAGQVLKGGHSLDRFLALIAGGVVIGLLGVAAVLWVPGGAPRCPEEDSDGHLIGMRNALRDANFVRYLAAMGAFTIGVAFYLSFLPLFLKQQLGVPAGMVVTLDAVIMIAGALSALGWGSAADRYGSRPTLMIGTVLTLLVPLGWLLLPRHVAHPVLWCVLLYTLHGVALSGASLGAYRLLLNDVIPPARNTAYIAVFYSWQGLVGGAAPLVAGALLQALNGRQATFGGLTADGYALLFVVAAGLVVVGWACYGRVRPDDRYRTRDVLQEMSNRLLRLLPWRQPL